MVGRRPSRKQRAHQFVGQGQRSRSDTLTGMGGLSTAVRVFLFVLCYYINVLLLVLYIVSNTKTVFLR